MSDLQERIDQAFDRCADCDGYYVKLSSHSCDARERDTTDPDREERVQRASGDTLPDDDDVAILPTRTVDGAYAYHELGPDHEPRCGGGGSLDDEWQLVAREEAKSRGKSPCLTCRRLALLSDDAAD